MNSPSSDKSLSRLLATWRVTPKRNPQFRPAVWSRIEADRQAPSWTGYARLHGALVMGTLALAIVTGGWIGRERARMRIEADRAAIASAYVHDLDARTMRMP